MSLRLRGFVISFLFLAISLVFLVVFSSRRQQAQSEEPRVEGYVYYANAKPMKKVAVHVVYSDGRYVNTETDGSGHYSLSFKRSNEPIRIRYLPQEEIFFPELEDLSGSTNHNISRTQQGKAGVYTASEWIDLNEQAQAVISVASDQKVKDYYRTLLSGARIAEGAVTNELTASFLQSLFNDTRRRYGMDPAQLTTEKGEVITVRVPFRQPAQRQPSTCMTADALKEMLDRICYGNPSEITGLSGTEALELQRRLDCRSVPRRLPNLRDRP